MKIANKANLVKKSYFSQLLLGFYFLVSALIVFGEFNRNINLLTITRPLLLPLLATAYMFKTKKVSAVYLTALVFGWLANIFYIQKTDWAITCGGICYLFYCILITFLILTNTRFPDSRLFVIAIIPFCFVYFYVFQLVYTTINEGVYLYLLHGVFMIFLGGYTLASYFIDSGKINSYLLISALLFTWIQFIISIDLYYVSLKIFRPIAFMMYTAAQLILMKCILQFDKNAFKLQ